MIRQLGAAILFILIIFIAGCKDDSISKATMDNGKKLIVTDDYEISVGGSQPAKGTLTKTTHLQGAVVSIK